MQQAQIHQIFYSEETRLALDPGFIPLDNVGQRPDWCEYWPMRNFLTGAALDEEAFYGFLSPKFKDKTGLTAADVHQFLGAIDTPSDVDIVTFSPFFDAGALFPSIFAQGADGHPAAWPVFVECVRLLAPQVNLEAMVMDSRHTVFCNYFVAKPRFWRHWLSRAEVVFKIAEENRSPLAEAFNSTIDHSSGATAIKVFVIERIVSLLLATERHWQVRAFNPLALPLLYPGAERVGETLLALDALKVAMIETGRSEYMAAFVEIVCHARQAMKSDQ
ncbi:hypothetical protein [Paraburkholderia sp. DHOC27]|uniref:hypothetical protein n=1 Tax=Paraburkholderia sp. DHOC27 TaxID=2303330 RepID=UPI000E3CA91B|nr:hypothetical protein [Paraburkholderia sp. DHOC27]RFU47448.1 hypothetical protein D0B32_15160 [Paraburkholderia sp. DHOC27]